MKKFLVVMIGVLGLAFLGCKKDEVVDPPKDYGQAGTHEVKTFSEDDYAYTTVYYPKDIATMDGKSPLIFLSSGWFVDSTTSEKYETLLQFIASQGYTVIYTDEMHSTDYQISIDGYNKIMVSSFMTDNILPHVNTNKIGVVGHSAGGGLAFKILDYYSQEKGYGTQGRFLLALDPWFAFGMDEDAMKQLPANTNLVIVKYGEGGYNAADGTDARIPLTEYSLLESISNDKKDYQVFEDADHNYPTGTVIKDGLLKTLDALMDYTFEDQSESVRKVALENGNDDPYADGQGIQMVYPKDYYQYKCDGANTLIDYCSIIP